MCRVLRLLVFLFWLLGGVASTALLGQAASSGTAPVGDPGDETPSTHRSVPLRLGSVDAVMGELSLRIPLGPRMPGRIGLGFSWAFDSFNPLHEYLGGDFRPIVWPYWARQGISGLEDTKGMNYTVLVNGDAWAFPKNWHLLQASEGGNFDPHSVMDARGIDDGLTDAVNEATAKDLRVVTSGAFKWLAHCSPDGRRFFVMTGWKLYNPITDPAGIGDQSNVYGGRRMFILDGNNVIWTKCDGVTHFQTIWGDHLSVTESGLTYGGMPNLTVGGNVIIKNENNVSQQISLSMAYDSGAPSANLQHKLTVSNTLGLPTIEAHGNWNYSLRSSKEILPESIYDHGYFLFNYSELSGDIQKTTTIAWFDSLFSGDLHFVCPQVISYYNGLVEQFEFGGTPIKKTSDHAFDPDTGQWVGFHPNYQYASQYKSYFPVYRLVKKSGNIGSTTVFNRIVPDWTSDARPEGTQWYETNHTTSISVYPTVDATGKCRTTKLTHQSYPVSPLEKRSIGVPGVANESEMQAAYLFVTAAVLKAELFDENGQKYRAVTYDGWTLHSFVNPNGVVAENGKAVTVPITASPTSVRIEELNKPPVIKVMKTWDTFGYKNAYSGEDAPADIPDWSVSASGTIGGWEGNAQPASAVNILTSTSNIWTANYTLLPVKIEKLLSGASLGDLREDAGSGGSLETTEFVYDTLGRPAKVVTYLGTNEKAELHTYSGSNPNPDETVQAVITGYRSEYFNGQVITYPEYLDFSGQAGKNFTYGSGPDYFLLSEQDKLTGATTTYVRDSLGRVTKTTDPNGVVTTTSYDGWGRVGQVVRQAIGTVGATTETHSYDPSERWSEVSISAEGKVVTARTEVDAFGRTVREVAKDGGIRTTTYNGFGEMASQSPWLRPGQASYGNFTYAYDAKGRLTETRDPKGRVVSSAPDEPAWDAALKGVKTTTLNDRNLPKSVVTDLLGQTRKIIDEKGQIASFSYDFLGHMIRTEFGGQIRSYGYNALGHLISRVEPEEGVTTYSHFTVWGAPAYTTKWRPTNPDPSVINENEVVVTTFDAKGRPAAIGHSSDNPTFSRTITYDDTYPNRVTSILEQQPFGWLQETYGYDRLGRIVQKTVRDDQEQTFTVSRTLDSLGNLTNLTYPGLGGASGKVLQVTYDSYFRPQAIYYDGQLRGGMTYDQVSGSDVSTTLGYGNGASSLQTQSQGELARVRHATGGSTVEDSALTWTAGGLLLSRGQDVFQYDELNRLTAATVYGIGGVSNTQTFEYDLFGNRTKSASSSDSLDEALSWQASYGLDNRLPSNIQGIAGEMLTGATYDDFGRLAKLWAVPGKSESEVNWSYDASGRVIQQNSVAFLLDAQGLRFRRASADGIVSYTVYGFDRDPLATFEAQVPAGSQASQASLLATKSIATAKSAAGSSLKKAEAVAADSPSLLRQRIAKPSAPARFIRSLGSASNAMRSSALPKAQPSKTVQ